MAALTQAPAKTRYSEVKRISTVYNISVPVASSLAAGGVVKNTIAMRGGVDYNVNVTLQTPTDGVVVDAYFSATGTVTIRQTNVTPSSITTVAASVGQVIAFFNN